MENEKNPVENIETNSAENDNVEAGGAENDNTKADGVENNNSVEADSGDATSVADKKAVRSPFLKKNFFKTPSMKKEKTILLSLMMCLAVIIVSLGVLSGFAVPDNHIHDYKLELAIINDEFCVVGRCDVEGCDSPVYSEKNVKDYFVALQTAPTCVSEGKYIFACERMGQVLYYTVYRPKVPHKFDGKDYSASLNSDGAMIYGASGVLLLHGTEYKCEETVLGGFTCESCNKTVTVNVYMPHQADEEYRILRGNEPTCEKAGKESSLCLHCDKVLDEKAVSATGHDYSHSLIRGDGGVELLSVCDNVGCESPTLRQGGLELTEERDLWEPETCDKYGKKVYSYTVGEETLYITLLGSELASHTLNGAIADSLMGEDGCFVYGTEGVELYDGDGIKCGEVRDGYYVCDECGSLVQIRVSKPGHSYAFIENIIEYPTLTEAGEAKVFCTKSDCPFFASVILPAIDTGVDGNSVISGKTVKYTYVTDFGFVIHLTFVLQD